jgi:hypothetical protein
MGLGQKPWSGLQRVKCPLRSRYAHSLLCCSLVCVTVSICLLARIVCVKRIDLNTRSTCLQSKNAEVVSLYYRLPLGPTSVP